MTTKGKPNNKNLRALFSVICLCIIALGLIVYFSTQTSSGNEQVNEATTVKQTQTTEVQKRVTVADTTTTVKQTTSAEQKTTSKPAVTTTEPATMQSNDTNTPYKSYYKYPCEEASLTGYTQELIKNETMGDYRAHTAVDFKGERGSKVVAVNDGLVLSVEKDNLLGTVIEIDHGGKLVARYCGVDTVNVSAGDYVAIGQTIATLGNVPFEARMDAHLHFETLLDGKYVDPILVMNKAE